MKKLLCLLCAVLIIGGLAGCSDERKNNSDNDNKDGLGETLTSDEFLKQFENFEEELRLRLMLGLAISYEHDDERAEEHIENYLKNAGTPGALYGIYKTSVLEGELGTDFEMTEDGHFELIAKEMVTYTLSQYGIDESKINYAQELSNYDKDSDYFLLSAFSGSYHDSEILYNTLVYSPNKNIVTFNIKFYEFGTNPERAYELGTFKYEFQPFLYKDKIQCYKFISVEQVS